MFLDHQINKKYPVDNTHMLMLYWENLNQANLDNNCTDILAYFEHHKPLLDHIFSISPYLSDNIIKDIEFYNQNLSLSTDEILQNLLATTTELGNCTDQTKIMRELRICKRRVSTLCGIMDITGTWAVMDITKNLSTFASTVCHSTLNHCLRVLEDQNILTLDNKIDPALQSGFSILGMGKLGGEELNYSSDIDLIAFYDMDKIVTSDTNRFREKIIRSFKNFITILEHKTIDGYVFRTDFRLRPNPSMTPVIMSKTAMLQYYETMGLNWERSAMIKAKPVAGDKQTGLDFLHNIKSFIWRKNLDFMALEDIYTVKNKINTHRSNFDLKVSGHNVKLGVGGIREIEFFAQSQQLIWGGRISGLRSKKTLSTLDALVKYEQITTTDADTLKSAYLYHRTLEHRLQMIKDEQTHTIPTDIGKIETVSKFMGYDNLDTFQSDTLSHLQNVAKLYTKLFQDKHIDDNGDAQIPLHPTGFKNMETVNRTVTHWQSGQYRATRSEKSRQLLSHLETDILRAFEQTANSDETLALFDQFLEKLPAGIQLFSLFKSNPQLLKLLASIMGNAPRLAGRLVNMPSLLDSLISKRYIHDTMCNDALNTILQNSLNDANDFQDVLEIVRIFKAELFFEQGIRILENIAKPHDVANGLTRVADVALQGLIPNTLRNMKYNAGEMPNGNFSILAFGKLGGMEMTHRSDVDLVFIYDHPDQNKKSTGKRSLAPAPYYTGLCQRIITGISSMTPSGQLFETDVRLRPNGNAGSLATSLASFKAYYSTNQAWTWEHMALTRARILYSSSDVFTKNIEDVIKETLTAQRDSAELFNDVAVMRRKMQDEFYDGVPWYIKHRDGGLVDVEFIAQTLQLQNAHTHPDILSTNTMDCYNALLSNNIINAETYKTLTDALVLWHNIQGIIRLTTADRFYSETATAGQWEALLKCTGFHTIDTLEHRINTLTRQVRKIFNTIVQTEI